MTKRRKFTPAFKAKIALEALSGEKTIQEIAAKYGLHPTQVSTFKREAIEGLEEVFSKSGKSSSGGKSEITTKDVEALHAKIGRLTIENDFLSKGLGL